MMIRAAITVDRANTINCSNEVLLDNRTLGCTVLMGFNTFKALNLPEGLPGRKNVILSRKSFEEIAPFCSVNPIKLQPSMSPARRWRELPIQITDSFNWVQAHQACLGCIPPDLWILGGAQVLTQAIELQLIDELYLTILHDITEGIELPIDLAAWKLFILRQRKGGVFWDLRELSSSSPAGASCTCVTMTKSHK